MTSSGRVAFAELAYAELVADFVTASAVDVPTGLGVNVIAPGRPMLIRLVGLYQNSVAAGIGVISVVDEVPATLILGSQVCGTSGVSVPFVFERRVSYPAGTPKTFSVVMRVVSGNGKLYATPPDVCSLQVLQL